MYTFFRADFLVTLERCPKLQFPFVRGTNGRLEQNLKIMLHYIPQTVCLDIQHCKIPTQIVKKCFFFLNVVNKPYKVNWHFSC